MKDLVKIGARVNDAVQAVWEKGPTVKEMEALEAYINQHETLTPLMDPAFTLRHGFKLFGQAKERIKLLKPILQLKESEREAR